MNVSGALTASLSAPSPLCPHHSHSVFRQCLSGSPCQLGAPVPLTTAGHTAARSPGSISLELEDMLVGDISGELEGESKEWLLPAWRLWRGGACGPASDRTCPVCGLGVSPAPRPLPMTGRDVAPRKATHFPQKQQNKLSYNYHQGACEHECVTSHRHLCLQVGFLDIPK